MSLMLGTELLLAGAAPLRPQDVFATSLYTGNGGTQTITNGLDLAGKGGLVWTKNRAAANSHTQWDTQRGARKALQSDSTIAENDSGSNGLQSFNSNGFTLGPSYSGDNSSGSATVAWSFRRAKKFFDIVTYTGNGQPGRQIPHGLGDVPGMIVVKARSGSGNWYVYHRALGTSAFLQLDQTGGQYTPFQAWSNPTATTFGISSDSLAVSNLNQNGTTYVAYLFAHNPDLIDCGSYVGNGSSPGPSVVCGKGWRPQFLLVKQATGSGAASGSWLLYDSARSPSNPRRNTLQANSSDQERAYDFLDVNFTANGFQIVNSDAGLNQNNGTYIYLAIRSPT